MAAADLTDLLTYRTHPDVLRYLPDDPMTPEKATAFLNKQAVGEPGDQGGYFALAVHHPIENKMIGEVGMYIQPKLQSSGDIGWIIHPDHQRQGYATEAATAMLEHGFTHRGLHRITASCDAPNVASLRIMKRLSMRREAHYLKNRLIAGVWHDSYVYAILREEWLDSRDRP